jgi:hypothetical protein
LPPRSITAQGRFAAAAGPHLTTICEWLGRVLVPVRTQPVRPFVNRTALMDISSDDELSTIASLNHELFYKHFIKDRSDSVSFHNDSDFMVAMVSILHEESKVYMPQWMDSMAGRATNLDRNREAGHMQ